MLVWPHPGHDPRFAYDNEEPNTQVALSCEIADRLVPCGDWRAFIEDGGSRATWLSEDAASITVDGAADWTRRDGELVVAAR